MRKHGINEINPLKIGNKQCQKILYSFYFFLVLSFYCQAQTGNNWKIMVVEPTTDVHWRSIGLTKSKVPKFPTSVGHSTNQGSCVMIGGGLVLTVAHVIRATQMTIMVDNMELTATPIAIDLYNDRALLRLKKEYKGPIKKLRETPLVTGEILKSYGYGRGYGYHSVTFIDDIFYGDAYYGDSGGPILDSNGEVVGVVSATSADPVTKKNNIFNHGWKNLVKWVEDNRANVEAKITLTEDE